MRQSGKTAEKSEIVLLVSDFFLILEFKQSMVLFNFSQYLRFFNDRFLKVKRQQTIYEKMVLKSLNQD